MEKLPLFADQQHLIHDIGTEDTNDPQIPSADEQQIVSRSTQPPCVIETIIISDDEIEPPQTPTIDEVQQDTSRPAEQHPTVEILPEPPQLEGGRLDTPHRYNTRMRAYKKNLADFIAKDQEMLRRMRQNQQYPTALDASTPHGQWSHSEVCIRVNLLRLEMPIIKKPNYSLTKRYKPRKARSKKAPVTSTTTSSATCSTSTSTMGCAKDTSNQQ